MTSSAEVQNYVWRGSPTRQQPLLYYSIKESIAIYGNGIHIAFI